MERRTSVESDSERAEEAFHMVTFHLVAKPEWGGGEDPSRGVACPEKLGDRFHVR